MEIHTKIHTTRDFYNKKYRVLLFPGMGGGMKFHLLPS